MLYEFFLLFYLGTTDHKVPVTDMDLNIAITQCCKSKSMFGCSTDFETIAFSLMNQHDLIYPTTREQAEILYTELITLIDNL